MTSMRDAARAYQSSSGYRSARLQEADVFHRANGVLRTALNAGSLDRVRAVADNRQRWRTVMDLMHDPENRLPVPVRASLVSVGRSVQREMEAASPDLDFLIAVNENIAAGLSAP